jgi:hypothetical protein
MAASILKKNLRENGGQSIFELIVFVPLLLIVLTIMINTGNAINASINQQKATRGYYYFLLRGNSMIQRAAWLSQGWGFGFTEMGFNAVGWRKSDAGSADGIPFAACFKYSSFLSNLGGETECDDPSDSAEQRSPFVKIFTVYGMCSQTYQSNDNGANIFVNRRSSGTASGCILR